MRTRITVCFVPFLCITPQVCHLQEKSSYRNFALVEHNTIRTHHPVAISSQVGQNKLNSGLGFVHVDCQLVSCCLPVSSDSTSEDDQIRCFFLAKEFVLMKQSGSIHASAPVKTITYDKNISYLIILNDHLSIDSLKAAFARGKCFRCGSLRKGFLE